jgi:hypothetical protein
MNEDEDKTSATAASEDIGTTSFAEIDAQFAALDATKPGETSVMGAEGEIRNMGTGRYGADDAAFYAQATGNYDLADQIRTEYSAPSFSTKLGDFVSSKFGSSSINKYGIDPSTGYIGSITDDYEFTDLVGNVMGMLAPGKVSVDRFATTELTSTGRGNLEFGVSKGNVMGLDIGSSYAVTPEQQQQMYDEQRNKPPSGGDSIAPTMVAQARPPAVTARGLMQSQPMYSYTTQDYTNPFSYFQGPSSATAMYDRYAAATGGPMGAQQDGQQEAVTGPVGFVGGPPEQMTEAETVADDVPVDVQEGAYVLNAAAVEYMGSADVKRMILDAMQELKAQGVDKAQNIDKIGLDTQVSLLVSKGEVLIPPQVAQVIGYDRLEKINKRGLRETEKRVQENGQSPEAEALDQQPVNPAEGMAMFSGGKTASEILNEEMPYATNEGPENRARVLKRAQEADPEGFAEIQEKNTDDLTEWMNIAQFYADDYVSKSPEPIQKLDAFLLNNAPYNMTVQYGSEDSNLISVGERGRNPEYPRGLKTGKTGTDDALMTLPGENKTASLLYHEYGHVAQPRDAERSTLQRIKTRIKDTISSLGRPAGEPGAPQEEVAVTSLDLYRALHSEDIKEILGSIEYLDYQFSRQGLNREFVPDFTTDEGVAKLADNAAAYALEVVESNNLYSDQEKEALAQDIKSSFAKNADLIKKFANEYRSGNYSPTIEAYRRNTMATGGISSREEMLRQIDEDLPSFYENRIAGEMGPALGEAREIRDGVNGVFNVHRMYDKLLRDIEEYKAPETMSRTNVEMGQTQSQRDTTLMEVDGEQSLVIDDMTPQNAANMYQNFPSFRTYIMDRIEAGQSEQVQSVLDNYEKFLKTHAGDNLPEQNPVYTEEDFAKARELDETETLRDLLNSRVVSETPVEGFISKSY